uniref:U3 small nucleolar RNA-associated protein 6 homolog n=1 Tax=Trichuris muris TaxID=70415 RepID=A0A5S6R3C0_TRIMR
MSEHVERYLEQLLPVFENLERLQLFSREEIRLTVAKLKSHEYRIQRVAKRKDDVIAYIQYLFCLSKLIAKRRRVVGTHAARDEINKMLNNKIEHLYKIACRRYPNDESIWLSRIEFAKTRGMSTLVGKQYNQMLKLNPKKPHLWIAAAKWEMEENMSTQNARTLLHGGVRFNKKCAKLWIELLRFELLTAEKVLKRRKVFLKYKSEGEIHEENVESTILKLPSIVFRHSVKAIEGDRQFCCQLLQIARSFPFATELTDQIERYMNERFSSDVKQIDYTIRKQCWYLETFGLKTITAGVIDESSCIGCFSACCRKYMEAIQSLRSYDMRLLFIRFCRDAFRLPLTSGRLREQCYIHLFFGYAMAYANCQCDTGLFVDWASVCPNVQCKMIVLHAGLRRFPKAVELWLLLLKYQLDAKVPESTVDAAIKKAKQFVQPDNALPVWKKAIALYSRCPGRLLEEFKSGIHLQPSISNYIKQEYLRFAYKTGGIQRARKLYHEKLCVVSPASPQLHYLYVSMEMEQKPPCVEQIRKSYEKAVVDHGNDVNIWLDYLLFETTIGNPVRS